MTTSVGERLWELLMVALYRAGRQADALAAFRLARSHLVDELGWTPDPASSEWRRRSSASRRSCWRATRRRRMPHPVRPRPPPRMRRVHSHGR